MIQITDKHKCCGCSACMQACAKQCISFEEDAEGFRYPKVDVERCVDCGLCEKVCPFVSLEKRGERLEKVCAVVNPQDEVRAESSSGGVFTILAEDTLNEGGVVFGARFNENFDVIHSFVGNEDSLSSKLSSLSSHLSSLSSLRGSKYVQSQIGDSYKQARDFLKQGRKILFTGTPCQIAGLKLFLRKEYENLLTVECVCHGVPSPGMWRQYLEEQTMHDSRTIADIKSINFRDKCSGWANYSFTIIYKDGKTIRHLHDDNPWERAFIKNIDLRPSCHNCPAKCNHSRADITLGDLWGAGQLLPVQNDNKGITLVLAHNKKGLKCLSGLKCLKEFTFEEVAKYNQALIHSAPEHPMCTEFFQQVQKKGFIKTVRSMTKDPFVLRIKIAIAKIIRR